RAGRTGGLKLSDLEKSHLVTALGRIGDPSALPAVVESTRKKGSYTRRSAVIALGRLVPRLPAAEQLAHVNALAGMAKNEKDPSARYFGLISLGRIGGHPGASEAVRRACVDVLVDWYKNGNKTTERPFAALALGLIGCDVAGEARKPTALRYRLAELIRADLEKLLGDKTALGAHAIALGLLADDRDETVSLLVRILEDPGLDPKFRGAAATGLALIGGPDATDSVIKALNYRENSDLRVELALAAGLLGGSRAVKPLLDVVVDPKASQHVLGSAAAALGRIRDPEAVAPLVAILEADATNGRYPDLTRSLAAVALGLLCEPRERRVFHRLSADCNYRAAVPTLDDLLMIR
ncbi:MAG: HEAT repeat domain-containing protein, partial [Planctomycetota bacterium]